MNFFFFFLLPAKSLTGIQIYQQSSKTWSLLRRHFEDSSRKIKSLSFLLLSCSLVRLRSGEFRQQPQLWPHSISPHPPALQPAIQTRGHAVTAKQHRYLTAPPRLFTEFYCRRGETVMSRQGYISKPSFCHVAAEPLLSVFFHFSTLLSVDTVMYISTLNGTLPLAF